jgi:hypothetical protein
MKKENIALIIFLVFIIGAGVYFYSLETAPQNVAETNPVVVSPEPQKVVATTSADMTAVAPQVKVSTEGWKTCRNEEYGYEFKYPAEWYQYSRDGRQHLRFSEVAKKCDKTDITLSNAPLHDPNTDENTAEIYYFSVRKNTDLKSLDEWLESAKNFQDEENLHIDQKSRQVSRVLQSYLIDGQKAVFRREFYLTGVVNPNSGQIILMSKDTKLRIIMTNYPPSKDFSLLNDTFETILSTFKFIN